MMKKSMQSLMRFGVFVAAMTSVYALATDACAQSGNANHLSIVQFCNAQGFKCSLAFVDTREGEDVVATVKSYLAKSGEAAAGSQISVQASCSPGWVASVRAEEGTVSNGGVVTGSATVCGYTDPVSALKVALSQCNEQTAGICKNANHIKAVWGQWKGQTPNQRVIEPGRPYDPMSYPDGQQCDSTVPIYSTSKCLPQALSQLKEAGMP